MSDRITQLYERYGPIIYARCVRLLADRAAAEDATQETFMRVQRHLEKAPDEALGWIYRIATNYCLNELRDRKHRPEFMEPELLDAHAHACDKLFEDHDLVARIIRRTAPKIRAVAWLHHVDGLDQSEVARVLGISRRSVVNHLAEFARNARKYIERMAS